MTSWAFASARAMTCAVALRTLSCTWRLLPDEECSRRQGLLPDQVLVLSWGRAGGEAAITDRLVDVDADRLGWLVPA